MKLVLCPRCELNYIINESEQYCKVCMREMHGETTNDDVELCSVCNEAPVLPGRDVCLFCLKEMNQQSDLEDEAAEQDEGVDASSIAGMDSVATMDEIIPEMEDDIPGDLENALSLESVREEEEKKADEEDMEEEEI